MPRPYLLHPILAGGLITGSLAGPPPGSGAAPHFIPQPPSHAEIAAVPPVNVLLQETYKIMQLDAEGFRLRDPKRETPATPEELEALRQRDRSERAAAFRTIDDAKAKITSLVFMHETKGLVAPAISMVGLARQLSAVHQEMHAALDAGKGWDSPGMKVLVAKAEVFDKPYHEQTETVMRELKRVMGAMQEEKTAKAAVAASAAADEQSLEPALALIMEHRSIIVSLVDEISIRNQYLGQTIPADVQADLVNHPEERKASQDAIAELTAKLRELSPKAGPDGVNARALKLDQAGAEVRASFEQVLQLVLSGKPADSPEALAIRSKADPARKTYTEAAAYIQQRGKAAAK
ncbi:hypothetical protein OJ996_25695 [Luteolibacter sp. GHJ8]|uniref:YfdX protein n=1 Tax=Luteolibacter rhizosphaerae TaxID=2989719 RepID=A0ABT3GC15_9BACT|nr:hypothetical protein [Luteolibacter rhizosphaerae]MCW1917009.1 hypothetical protein [Luteolibacter rhizosphaerae]